jgi:hypothetical protein
MRCSLLSKTKLFEQPCLKAHFVEIAHGGSCNYFSQRQINHLTLDGVRRIRKTLPETLQFNDLLSFTSQHQQNSTLVQARTSVALYYGHLICLNYTDFCSSCKAASTYLIMLTFVLSSTMFSHRLCTGEVVSKTLMRMKIYW